MSEPFEIDTPALKARLDGESPPALLDVREGWERDIVAIDNSIAIPMGDIPRRVAELPRDTPLAVMCHHGGRSAQVTGWLRQQGFDNAFNVAGGIDAWARLVDPSLSRY